jgi:hypothetical protein
MNTILNLMLTAILVIIKIRSLTAVCPLPLTPFQSLKNGNLLNLNKTIIFLFFQFYLKAIITGNSAGITLALSNNASVNSVYPDAQNASPLIYCKNLFNPYKF